MWWWFECLHLHFKVEKRPWPMVVLSMAPGDKGYNWCKSAVLMVMDCAPDFQECAILHVGHDVMAYGLWSMLLVRTRLYWCCKQGTGVILVVIALCQGGSDCRAAFAFLNTLKCWHCLAWYFEALALVYRGQICKFGSRKRKYRIAFEKLAKASIP